jgi:hypothetical protein
MSQVHTSQNNISKSKRYTWGAIILIAVMFVGFLATAYFLVNEMIGTI